MHFNVPAELKLLNPRTIFTPHANIVVSKHESLCKNRSEMKSRGNHKRMRHIYLLIEHRLPTRCITIANERKFNSPIDYYRFRFFSSFN